MVGKPAFAYHGGMNVSRREFLAGAAAAGACAMCGCVIANPALTFDAAADGTLPIPPALARAGDQIKVRIPGIDDPVLVWKTEDGYGAASVTCTHRGSEVSFVAARGTLDCPSHGSRFNADGSVLHGPAKRPLASYRAEASRGILTIAKK